MSCTTDGFLVKVGSDFEKEAIAPGAFGKVFQLALTNLGIASFYLEEKHNDKEGAYS